MSNVPVDEEPATPGGQPTVSGGDGLHTHPLPKWVRVVAACYGALIFLFGGDVLLTITNQEENNRKQRQVILELIEERTLARDAENAEIQAQIDRQRTVTRAVVCELLLNDFEPSPTVDKAIDNFRCKTPTPPGG